MSESEYELGQDGSDQDFENSEQPKPRLRQIKRPKNYQAIYREPKPPQEKRLTRRKLNPQSKEISYNDEAPAVRQNPNNGDIQDRDDYLLDDPPEDDDQESIFNLEIALIIWKRKRDSGEEDEYLIKFKNRSYLHVEWHTEEELSEMVKNPKNKINRFNKNFNKRLVEGNYDEEAIEEGKYFDPAYLEVDRILTTTEFFPVIHQKKANEIKGKWSESLMIVCSKLLNFTRSKIHYGVLFSTPVNPDTDNCPQYFNIVKQPMDLGTILNKIYLDIYKNSRDFWIDIGLVWKNCLKFNTEENSDLRILGLTLRECSIFLYDQWFHLSEERYQSLTEEFPELLHEAKEDKMDQEKPQDQGQKQNEVQQDNEPAEKMQEQKPQNQAQNNENGGNGGIQKEANGGRQKENMEAENNEIEKHPQMPKQQTAKKGEGQVIEMGMGVEAEDSVREKSKGQHQSNEEFDSEGEDIGNNNNNNSKMDVEKEPKEGEEEDENSSEEKRSKSELEDEDREYLNMDQFYQRNIFLSEKKVENPTCHAELHILHPGEFSYGWLDEEGDGSGFMSHSYEYIDRLDMKRLDLNTEVDRLYMVKWKNLSYSEATYELQSVICCPDKINEFRNINKALGRQARTQLDMQREKHICIRDFQIQKKKRFTVQNINEMKNKLYSLDVGLKKEPHQYKPENIPVYRNYKLLRSYQLESLNWLIKSWYSKRNTILADEMGLGKTIQSIAFLYHLYSVENVKGPFLIIAPLSTLEHWKRTVEEWTTMNCVLYYDQNGHNGRASIRYYEWYHMNITMKGLAQQSTLNKFQVLITSYEVFLLDFQNVLLDIPFQFVVVDEAHRLKNKNAKILTSLRQLPCKRVLLLTGTPIQNNTQQLWSLLNYIHPEKFSSSEMFKREFGDLSNNEQVDKLNRTLKPYMLRRMKEDVEQSIPPLQETIIDVEMTNIQKTIYRALYEKNKAMLVKGLSSSTNASYNTNLNNLEIQLRKCCNHPCLIKELEQDLLKECESYEDKIEKIVNASGKMVLVKKLLEKCKKEGKKVLIFSQFTHMLQLIEEFLKYKEYKYERIDGQIKAKERQISIDRYNNPAKKRDVFLLSTKAGGVGINLTSANVVIIYDSDWNPQNDVQATARAHRIGQTSEVQVYRLITSNTYETQMFERATQKLGLDKAIFISGHFKETGESSSQNKLTKEEMETLLKKGILGFLEGQENQNFFDGNVDDIIAKNSRIAKYSLINGSCSFSKSKFISNESDNELKVNDPNFWNIVLKNVESPTQILLKKIKASTDLKNPEVQKELMHEAANLMNSLIENKLSLSAFNADDEINLSEFLTLVNSERLFNKQYRDMASTWLEQICKPSRRFKKMTIEDLQISKKGFPVKKNLNTRSQNEGGDIFVDSDRELEEEDESDEKQKVTDQKKEELLKRLCFLCQQPKCVYHCKGYCKRAFHAECRKKVEEEGILNYDDLTGKLDPSELCLDEDNLKQITEADFTCEDCLKNAVICFICKIKGSYFGVEYQKTKKSKSTKPGGEEKESKSKRKNEVTKCSTANCSKYFHPKCVQNYDVKKHFKYIDANSLHFRCSLHYCDSCGVSGDTMSILQCVRCPKALHIRCMDKQKVVKLSKKQIICDNHFKNKKDLKKVSERFNLNSIKKPQTKKEKEVKKKEEQEDLIQADEKEEKNEKNEEDIIHHSYKTRRNRGTYNEDTLIKIRVPEDHKPLRIAKEKGQFTYEELGLTPIHDFDYETYDKDWCRYCGTRYSSNFTKGPWGSKTLCTVHYIYWNTTKTLNLDSYVQKPRKPINPDSEQELKFINNFAGKHPEMSKEEIIESLEKKNTKRIQ